MKVGKSVSVRRITIAYWLLFVLWAAMVFVHMPPWVAVVTVGLGLALKLSERYVDRKRYFAQQRRMIERQPNARMRSYLLQRLADLPYVKDEPEGDWEVESGVYRLRNPYATDYSLTICRKVHRKLGLMYALVFCKQEFLGPAPEAGNERRKVVEQYSIWHNLSAITYIKHEEIYYSGRVHPGLKHELTEELTAMPDVVIERVERYLVDWESVVPRSRNK